MSRLKKSLRVSAMLAVAFLLTTAGAPGSEREDGVRDAAGAAGAPQAPHVRLAGKDAEGEDREPEVRRREIEDRMADRQRVIHHKRLEQIELQAVAEKSEMSGDHGAARDARRRLVDVERELQQLQVELEFFAQERQREMEQRELMRMSERFDYVANWRDVAFEPPGAVMMATQAIVELHVGADDVAGAAERLEGLLDRVDERGSRTAIRFALKDVYVELNQPERAVDHMVKVILENANGGDAR